MQDDEFCLGLFLDALCASHSTPLSLELEIKHNGPAGFVCFISTSLRINFRRLTVTGNATHEAQTPPRSGSLFQPRQFLFCALYTKPSFSSMYLSLFYLLSHMMLSL